MKWIPPDGDIEFEIEIKDGQIFCLGFDTKNEEYLEMNKQELFELKYAQNKISNSEEQINEKISLEEQERIDSLN